MLGNSGTGLITCLDTDASGTLFGIDLFSGDVLLLDKVTGAPTTISTAITGFQGLGIDAATGAFFGSNTDDESLYLIDVGDRKSVV